MGGQAERSCRCTIYSHLAEQGLIQALQLHIDIPSPRDQRTLDVLRRLVLTLIYRQNFAVAARLAQRLLEDTEMLQEWDSERTCHALILLAGCNQHNGAYDIAEQELKECSGRTSLLPKNRQEFRYLYLLGLAKLAQNRGNTAQADVLLKGVIRYRKEVFGHNYHAIAEDKRRLG